MQFFISDDFQETSKAVDTGLGCEKVTLNGKLERSTWLADGEGHVLAVSGAQMVLERLYEDSD